MRNLKSAALAGLVFLISVNVAVAQEAKRNHIWYFGDNAGIDFSNGRPVALTNGAMSAFEGTATMSDLSGQLMFYTNGGDNPSSGGVWNRNHQLMPNGSLSGAGGCASAFQSSLILNQPKSNDIYYLFTNDCQENGFVGGFRYSIIDMNLDGGLGDVAVKGIKLADKITEGLTAVRHANGQDYWIITHKLNADSFFVFHLTPVGIQGVLKQKIGAWADMYSGEISAATNGQKIAHHTSFQTMLYDFDNATGKISNPKDLGTASSFGAFSPDCKYLYANQLSSNNVYQFDVIHMNPKITRTVVGNTSPNMIGSIKVGPDHKMYVSKYQGGTLDIIKKPNLKGTECLYSKDSFDLAGKTAAIGLPNFANDVAGECQLYPVENTSDLLAAQLSVKQITSNSISVNWTPINQALTYQIKYRKMGESNWNTYIASSAEMNLQNLESNSTYEMAIDKVLYSDGAVYEPLTGHETETVLFGIENKVNTFKATTSDYLDAVVYPNPARENAKVAITLPGGDKNITFSISDLNGKVFHTEEIYAENVLTEVEIPTAGIPNGIYMISVSSEEMRRDKRFVVLK